ncbi:MAG: 2-oxoglutarate dehydrogenase E1 component, partial [Planctomycetota bacterium]
RTGGTIHIVVNNHIGFTTGQEDARSSRYCTDMAKMIEAPVLHVNGEDPEAAVHAINLALDYRMRFRKDVVIDLLCYRRHGHNESDEAAFTQPLLYKMIREKASVLETYAQALLEQGVISDDDHQRISAGLDEELDRAYLSARETPVDPTPDPGHRLWVGLENEFSFTDVYTGVPKEVMQRIAGAMGTWPESFTPHRKLVKMLQKRSSVIDENIPMDWATAELFAVGTLLLEGVIVRFSGQDSRRGTFSQRHAVLRDFDNGDIYVPLNHMVEMGEPGTDREVGTVNEDGDIRQAKFCVYDSPLSEFAVLGFEYGFSLASPRMLVAWEAQFGDFSNGAQVIIDQFIASAEAKWHRWSGVVLMLPHGYEGQGPEHSSARLERFLKLCGQNNIQVCYPTTPAQHFHMLRRQVLRKFRKPLIIMTPKSLLRHPAATSMPSELIDGAFEEVLDDPAFTSDAARKKVKRLLLCSGKVYYDLAARRNETERTDIAIVRLEQLYPLNAEKLEQIVDSYPGAELYWVQEEPKNMGAWGHVALSVRELFGWDLPFIGRAASASPATGSSSKHREELESLLSEAVGVVESAQAGAA